MTITTVWLTPWASAEIDFGIVPIQFHNLHMVLIQGVLHMYPYTHDKKDDKTTVHTPACKQ